MKSYVRLVHSNYEVWFSIVCQRWTTHLVVSQGKKITYLQYNQFHEMKISKLLIRSSILKEDSVWCSKLHLQHHTWSTRDGTYLKTKLLLSVTFSRMIGKLPQNRNNHTQNGLISRVVDRVIHYSGDNWIELFQ